MYLFDHDPMTPAGGALIAELGLNVQAVRDALADDRARRCPDRAVRFLARRFTDLDTHAESERRAWEE